jgi:hypothetical protein
VRDDEAFDATFEEGARSTKTELQALLGAEATNVATRAAELLKKGSCSDSAAR